MRSVIRHLGEKTGVVLTWDAVKSPGCGWEVKRLGTPAQKDRTRAGYPHVSTKLKIAAAEVAAPYEPGAISGQTADKQILVTC